jgi:tetratricopeptide (TPR) repeat protein
MADAAAGLEQLAARFPRHPVVVGLLGAIYHALGEYALAAKYWRIATEVSPGKEMPSLGLFHALWNLGESREAIREMLRFLAVEPQADYLEILEELKRHEEYGPIVAEELAKR